LAFKLFAVFVLAGAVVAGATVWGLTRPLAGVWRGLLIAIAILATCVLAAGTLPVEGILGVTGLTIYLLAALVVGVIASRAARKVVHPPAAASGAVPVS
jgi:hypothetical protein